MPEYGSGYNGNGYNGGNPNYGYDNGRGMSSADLQAIAELLGVPQEDRMKLFDWTNQMTSYDDPEFDVDPSTASMGLLGYAYQLAEARRAYDLSFGAHAPPSVRARARPSTRSRPTRATAPAARPFLSRRSPTT